MKTISQNLTAGALAVAGTVATFGLGSVAQALVPANATFGGTTGGVTFTGSLGSATSITFGSTTGLVTSVPATYTPFGGSSAPNDFNSSVGPAGSILTPFTTNFSIGGLTGGVLDFSNLTALTLSWTPTTTPANRYTFTPTSAAITSQSDTGLNIAFGGTFTDAGGLYSSGAASVSLSIASSGVGQGTDTFTFGTPPAFTPPPPVGTPEPGTVLGILAVAGAGAFARRKR
jgi:hypothetical protein